MNPHAAIKLPLSILLACVSVCPLLAQSPKATISTIAGRDNIFSTRGTDPSTTPLITVGGLAVDNLGNVLLAAPQDKVVLEITSEGRLVRIAGNGLSGCPIDGTSAALASLKEPQGLAVGTNGDLYIADRTCNRIYRVSADQSTITTVAGAEGPGYDGDGGPALYAHLQDPTGVAIGPDKSIYIADSANNVIRKVDPSGTINTFAGTGVHTYSNGDGHAKSASLATPMGVAIDASGTIYISDSDNARIRIVPPDGSIRDYAGSGLHSYCGDGGPATSACLTFPTSAWVSSDGVYISDAENNCVRKVAANIITTIAGVCGAPGYSGDGGPVESAELNYPFATTVRNGLLFVADANNGRVRVVNNGTVATIAGTGDRGDGGPAVAALLAAPRGVATDNVGNIYIADTFDNRIRKITLDGEITTVAGNGIDNLTGDGGPAIAASLSGPTRVIVDEQGSLYIADSSNGQIRKVDTTGEISTYPSTGLSLNDPRGMCLDNLGNLYVAEKAGHRVWKIAPGGDTSVVAGTGTPGPSRDNVPSIQAQLNGPAGVAIDHGGNLYIADSGNTRIRRIGTDGVITTFAGTDPADCVDETQDASRACLGYPSGIRIDGDDNLYIADYVIWKVHQDGTIEIVAGDGHAGFYGDGGPATQAALAGPSDIALDPGGNLYIADTVNNRIRLMSGTAPQLSLTPSTLTFSVSTGGSVQVQDVNLGSTLSGVPFTIAIQGNTSDWLQVEAVGRTAPTTLHVIVDPATLATGTYPRTINITSPVTGIPLTLTITVTSAPASPTQRLVFNPMTISLQVSGGESQTQTISITNTSSSSITANLTTNTNSGKNWLSVGSSTLNFLGDETKMVTVTAQSDALVSGTYEGDLVISVSLSERYTASVILTVGSGSGRLLLSTTGLWFDATASGAPPPRAAVAVINSGDANLDWSATVYPGSCNTVAPWLAVDNQQVFKGSTLAPGGMTTFPVGVNNSGLGPGMCTGLIIVTAPNAVDAPQSISIFLSVVNSVSDEAPRITVLDPQGLVFSGTAGVPVAARLIVVENQSALHDYTISIEGGDPWLEVQPVGNIKLGNDPLEITVRPRFEMLTAGAWESAVTFTLGSGNRRPYKVVAIAQPSLREHKK